MKKFKLNKILSLALAVMLLVSVIPMSAIAATPTAPTRTQAIDVETIESIDNLATEGWKWEKGATENTLTFKDCYIKAETANLLFIPDDKPLNIVCEGYNIIETTLDKFAPMVTNNTSTSDLTCILKGTGTIEFKLSSPKSNTENYVFAGDNVIIDGCTVKSNIALAVIEKEFAVKSGNCIVDLSYSEAGNAHRVIDSVKGPVNFAGGNVDFKTNGTSIFLYNQKSSTYPNAQINITGGNVKIHSDGDMALLATNLIINTDGVVDLYGTKAAIVAGGNDADIQIQKVGPGSKIENDPASSFKPIHAKSSLTNVNINIGAANYSELDAIIDDANSLDKTKYEDFSGVENAIAAVDRTKTALEQNEVDAMALAISDAVDALVLKPETETAKPEANKPQSNTSISEEETTVKSPATGAIGGLATSLLAFSIASVINKKREK